MACLGSQVRFLSRPPVLGVILRKIFALGLLIAVVGLSSYGSETVKGVKADIESFKAEMSQKLDKVEEELVELRAKAKEKGSDAKEDVIADLEKSRDRLKSELEKVDDKVSENWKKFKENFAKSLDNLNSKIQKSLKK